jgi:hypothetical protein
LFGKDRDGMKSYSKKVSSQHLEFIKIGDSRTTDNQQLTTFKKENSPNQN